MLGISETKRVVASYQEELQRIQFELSKSKLALQHLVKMCKNSKEIIVEYKNHIGKCWNLGTLLQKGGHVKVIVEFETAMKVQEINAQEN